MHIFSAIDNEDYEVADLLKKLSNMLSYTFSRKLVSVSLGQELRWVEQYLYLQKFRLMDVFDYEIEFQEEYGEWPCCKLFIQPFVENSILHVVTRLRMYYGEELSVVLESEPEKGTKFTFWLPIPENPEKDIE